MRTTFIAAAAGLAVVVGGWAAPPVQAGASSNYAKTVCGYLKNRAMAAASAKRRAALMEEYRRCMEENGEK